MGHESRIEPWLPMTTVLLVSFRTDWLRREDTMKTAWKETGNRWAAVFSIRMDGAAGQNRTCSSTWGWKQEKFQRWGKCFLLTSPSIEHPPRPQKRARIPTKPGLVSTRALSAGSCFIDGPCCAASPQASHRACPALARSCDKRTIHQNLRLISPFSRTEPYGASAIIKGRVVWGLVAGTKIRKVCAWASGKANLAIDIGNLGNRRWPPYRAKAVESNTVPKPATKARQSEEGGD